MDTLLLMIGEDKLHNITSQGMTVEGNPLVRPSGRTKGEKKVGSSSKMGNNKTTLSERNADMKGCNVFSRTREHWT